MNNPSTVTSPLSRPGILHRGTTLPLLSLDYFIALLPLVIWSCFLNGPRTLIHLLIGALSAVFWEAVSELAIRKRITVLDGSAALEGMLFAMMLPITAPYILIPIGTLVGTLCFKVLWGGQGKCAVHPAIGAYALMYPFFRTVLTTLAAPKEIIPITQAAPQGSVTVGVLDALADGAVPSAETLSDLLAGRLPGNMGQLSLVLLLIAMIYLFARHHLSPMMPLLSGVTVLALSLVLHAVPLASDAIALRYAVLQACAGSLIFLAVFPASHPAYAPHTARTRAIYAVGIGVLTVLIRYFGFASDGAVYAVLIMQLLVPVMHRYLRQRHYAQN